MSLGGPEVRALYLAISVRIDSLDRCSQLGSSTTASTNAIYQTLTVGTLENAYETWRAVQRHDRAMRIRDTLLKAIEARGWSVHVKPQNHHYVRVMVGEEEFGLYLYEDVATRPHLPTAVEKQKAERDFLYTIPKREKYLAGKLCLGFAQDGGNGGGASDGKRWRLEECLDLVVKGLAEAAAGAEEFRAQIERDRQARLAAERQREELERQHAMERRRAEEAAMAIGMQS